jgi:beta-mannosidase
MDISYGWDWGPVLMTVGPWRSIHFHTYEIRITEVWANAIVSEKLEPRVALSFDLAGDDFTGFTVAFLRGTNGAKIKETQGDKVAGGKCSNTLTFGDGEIELWYPVGYGKQPLYEIEVVATDRVSERLVSAEEVISRRVQHGKILDSVTKTIAFRRVQIVEKPLIDQVGLSWYFEINNIPVFVGGRLR